MKKEFLKFVSKVESEGLEYAIDRSEALCGLDKDLNCAVVKLALAINSIEQRINSLVEEIDLSKEERAWCRKVLFLDC